MHLNFKKVEIHNFMSYRDEVIEFSNYRGLTRIKGYNYDNNCQNGAGKSQWILSIIYGLFGKLPYKLKNENVYNRYAKDHNMSITIHLSNGNKNYKIVSGLKGKQSYCNVFEISHSREEHDITKSSVIETHNMIEKEILRCDIDIFMRTIVLNDDEESNFYKLKSADKKEFIDKLFDISIFGEMFSLIHRDCLSFEKQISNLQNQLMILNNNNDEYIKKIENFNNSKNNELIELRKEYDESVKLFKEKSKNVVTVDDKLIGKCNDGMEKLMKNIFDINEKISNNEISLRVSNNTVKTIDVNIGDMNKIISKHSKLYDSLCVDCKKIYSTYHNLDKYQSKIVELNNSKNIEISKQDELIKNGKNLEAKLKECNEKKTIINNKLKELTSKFIQEQKLLESYRNNINIIKQKIESIENGNNPFLELKDENDKNIANVEKSLSELINTYKYVKFSENIVSQDNLKKFIIHDMVNILNNRIKFYLHKLGANYDIVFDDNMDYEFVTTAKTGVEFNNFSKGEKARITIATCFAFRDFMSSRSNISSNIFVLDEFFDSNVDHMALENIIELLKDFTKNNSQKIFVVSHRAEISDDIFNKIITIKKKDNIASITHEKTI